MSTPSAPRTRHGFKIAIICALPLEADAVYGVFDVCWEDEGKRYGKARGDPNAYSTGAISGHPVVLAHMPNMGVSSASATSAFMRSSFPQIQLSIVVGICGVTPLHPITKEEIILGDIIISTAVVQYDFGRQYPNGFRRKTEIENSLGRAAPEVRAFISKLQTRQVRKRLTKKLTTLMHSRDFQDDVQASKYPGANQDHLYQAAYIHKHRADIACDTCSAGLEACSKSCDELHCHKDFLVPRKRHEPRNNTEYLSSYTPLIHFGRFGSANSVMKSSRDRDRIASIDKVVGFEMEGAGVWDQGSTIVVKAACDYADSHKNKDWQAYAAAAAAACLKAFLTEWTSADEVMEKEEVPKSAWYVPFDKLGGFAGRADELDYLKRKLFDPDDRRIMAIVGLGGIGKSRLALETAFQIRTERPGCSILWIDATEELTFEKDALAISRLLAIPGAEDEKVDVKQLFKQGLSNLPVGEWLLIIDNADDEALWGKPLNSESEKSTLMNYLPSTRNGSILITTRSRQVAVSLAGKELVDLVELSADMALKMFLGMLANQELAGDVVAVSTLLERLTFLPLAITQAASFINMTQVPVQTYLNLLDQPEDDVIKLLSKDFGDPSRNPNAKNPVAGTWLISFNYIRKNYPLAADILSAMACFHEKNIPQSLLPKSESELDFVEAIGLLVGYSFVRWHISSNTSEHLYDLHGLVQIAARNWLTMEHSFPRWKSECIRHTAAIFPHVTPENREIWNIYLPHAQRLCDNGEMKDVPERYQLLTAIGLCFLHNGRYSDAVRVHKIVAQYQETTGKQTNSDLGLSTAYHNLGIALYSSGDATNARRYLENALAISSEILGSEDPQIIPTVTGLGRVYGTSGLWTQAEEYVRKAMRVSLRVFGPDNPGTIQCMNHLVAIYRHSDRLQEAEKLCLRVVEASRRVLGEQHSMSISASAELGFIYSLLGRLEEAEELLSYGCNISARLYGPEHHNTLNCLIGLAATYAGQHRCEEAEALNKQTLRKCKKALGPEHPDTLDVMYNLALDSHAQSKIAEAIELMREFQQTSNRIRGATHRDTRKSTEILVGWQRELEALKTL